MIYKQFSVHDVKAGAYLPPFVLPRAAQASRIFMDCVNSKDHQFGNHPEDYTLFELGSWDDETAQYQLHDAPISLGNGVEYVRTEAELMATEGLTNAEASAEPTSVGDESPVLSSTTGGNSAQ